ncbi:hypothetical protein BU23DRAFT_21982 [Bimuria novae-zelandiae CBS 107.79]|uniref:Uncharacterized protein n=1 Tax=Bimuria novae-zelandiae CBS 107.79 TaxID=1447943 RepID=A0A6A5UNT9_9PLEO|nr:hypothetical protein BU23DRAFT_21982 [Bimuria novae-zelandiae CBS 107.79]
MCARARRSRNACAPAECEALGCAFVPLFRVAPSVLARGRSDKEPPQRRGERVTNRSARRRRSRYLRASYRVESSSSLGCRAHRLPTPSKLQQKPVGAAEAAWLALAPSTCVFFPDPWFSSWSVEHGLKCSLLQARPVRRPGLESLAIDPGGARCQMRCPQ